MSFDFDSLIDRRGTPSYKWHYYKGDDLLPMWVADMDFPSPPAVMEALHQRIDHQVFGYEFTPDELTPVLVARLKELYDWDVPEEAIVYLPGVVPGFNLCVRSFVGPDQALAVQTPGYMHIVEAAEEAGVIDKHMQLTCGEDGRYTVDFDAFADLVGDETSLFILCNPHNPVGRVFTKEELLKMADMCIENDVIICSDEIHADLVYDEYQHIPIASLSPEIADRTITLMAPSKTYNIAGLHCAFAIITNPELREKYAHTRAGLVEPPNLLGYAAALAAFKDGQEWLDAMMAYVRANRDYTYDYIKTHMPQIKMWKPEGTYLAWLDCREANLPCNPHDFFKSEAKVVLNNGAAFGPGGEGFVRLNFGCPRSVLTEGLDKMRAALDALNN